MNEPDVNVIVSTSFTMLAYPAAPAAGRVKTKGVSGAQLENPNRVTMIFELGGIAIDGVNETVSVACAPKKMLDRENVALGK